MEKTRERLAAWTATPEAMTRGDALGWLRARLSEPASPEALFAALGAERRALVAELRRTRGEEADGAIEAVEAFFDAVHAALYREAREAADALHDTNEQLRGLDALKDHFLATVSHELRTPLTWITGFGSILVEEPSLTDDHRYYVQKMLEGAFQLLGLVNDLLDYGRIKEGRLPLHREPFSPTGVAETLLAQYAPVARQAGLTLTGEWGPALPTLIGDRERVGQVLGNLIANALKFTLPGGQVAVRVMAGSGPVPAVRFEVEDTGPGIRPADQGRLFERFSQVEGDPGRRQPGTGLGLAISRGLVEAHGGEIGLTSPAPQAAGGCLFWFELPSSVQG